MRFHRISPCPKCGGKVKAKWERDGVQGLPEYTFFIVMFRCTVCGLGFEGGCSRKPAPYQLQYNIAAWNRICNGDKCFTLTVRISSNLEKGGLMLSKAKSKAWQLLIEDSNRPAEEIRLATGLWVDVIEQMRGDVQKRLRDNPEF